MASAVVEAALALARLRHEAIARGDFDAYTESDALLLQACAALAAEDGDTLATSDRQALGELIALETQSEAHLQGLMADASQRLETLRHSGRANGAYLRHERFSVNPA